MLCVAFTEVSRPTRVSIVFPFDSRRWLSQLLPEAVRMERHSFLAVGLIVGTFIMSASLVMLS